MSVSLLEKDQGRRLDRPWLIDNHWAQSQDEEHVCPSLQVHDSPQAQPEPQAQVWILVEQLQDWPQVQGLPLHSLFIGTSGWCVVLMTHTYPEVRRRT
jgi:hypothetical protein